jgi:hypothetical protein
MNDKKNKDSDPSPAPQEQEKWTIDARIRIESFLMDTLKRPLERWETDEIERIIHNASIERLSAPTTKERE